MSTEVTQRFPWEPAPVTFEDTARMVDLLRSDMAYAVHHTAIIVHSNEPRLAMMVNTARGQIVPKGECWFTNGKKIEFQDIGMPQPNVPLMTVPELMARIYGIAQQLGLEIKP